MIEFPHMHVQGAARVIPKVKPPEPPTNRLRDWWDFATFRKAAWLAQAVGKAVDVLKDFLRTLQEGQRINLRKNSEPPQNPAQEHNATR